MDVICLTSAQVPWMYAVIFSFDRADFPDLFFLVLFLCKISRLQLQNHLPSL